MLSIDTRLLAAAATAVFQVLFLTGCNYPADTESAFAQEREGHVSAALAAEWPDTNFSNRTVDLREIQSGGPPKDGIPAIDQPQFITNAGAALWLAADEPVMVVNIDNDARAYPLQIMMYHEIVNDVVAGQPIAVTFCPLCNASIVFERSVNGKTLDFGTTGKLRKSDLVMYDRQTESWWQQFTGKAIVGHYAGTALTQIRSQISAFDDFRNTYPGGRVLSRNTGFERPYGNNPYRGYDNISQTPFLLDDPADPRLPPMERVLGISVDGAHRVHPFSVFDKQPLLTSEFAGVAYVIFSKRGVRSALDAAEIAQSRVVPAAAAYERALNGVQYDFVHRGDRIFDVQTDSEWDLFGRAIDGPLKGKQLQGVPGGVHFAFAWLAFRPESEVFRAD